jgi:hypothetical protein
MSEQDLQNMGVIMKEEKWGKLDLKSTASKKLLITLCITVLISAFMMYRGNGNWLTWVGAFIFLVDLIVFTVHSLRAVDRQTKILKELDNEISRGNKE